MFAGRIEPALTGMNKPDVSFLAIKTGGNILLLLYKTAIIVWRF